MVHGINALQNGLNHPDQSELCVVYTFFLLFGVRVREWGIRRAYGPLLVNIFTTVSNTYTT